MTIQAYTATELAEKLSAQYHFGDKTDIFRVLRHYTNLGLLPTIGEVHTGTGKKRLYPQDSLIRAGILMRCNRAGLAVTLIKKLISKLEAALEAEGCSTLIDACNKFKQPCFVFTLPFGVGRGEGRGGVEGLAEEKAAQKLLGDAIVIHLAPYKIHELPKLLK